MPYPLYKSPRNHPHILNCPPNLQKETFLGLDFPSLRTMKSWVILCSTIFFLALYFFSSDIGFFGKRLGVSSSFSPVLDEESHHQGVMNPPSLPRKFKYHRSKVVEQEETKGWKAIAGGSGPNIPRRSGIDNLDDLVYHTDYHGVTTHPTPTPKHPKP
ncbi:hypothetical protein SAY87_007412 [Trapa incisa]|uniref:Uncharacterized protein n=1 Tax=Trapa incisa TaxID=236973 RepID=A0AAN7K4G2_9MYRT|nr:hypothetical protein SAY87_007412 [Trapa incisa]